MRKKDFLLGVLFTGVLFSVVSLILGSIITSKIYLTVTSMDVVSSTAEIVLIMKELEEEKVEHDYAATLLERQLNRLKNTKELTNASLNKGKEDGRYTDYEDSIQNIIDVVNELKDRVVTVEEINLEKDMKSFFNEVKYFGKSMETYMKRIW